MGLSLRIKWTAALLFAGAVPLAALSIGFLRIQKNGLVAAEYTMQAAVADHVMTLVQFELKGAADATHLTSELLFSDDVDVQAKLHRAEDAMAGSALLAEVAIYDKDGKLVDAIRRKDAGETPKSPENVPNLAKTLERLGAWTGPSDDATATTMRWVETRWKDGVLEAYVVGTLRRETIDAEVRTLSKNRFGDDSEVVVFDARMRVFAGGPFAFGAQLDKKDVLTSYPAALAQRGPRLVVTGEFRAENGDEMLGTILPDESRDFFVAVRRPTSEVFLSLRQTRTALFAAAAVFAVLALALGVWLAARTIRPLRALVELSRSYGKRAFATKSTVKTGDELEGLGDSLESMAADIAAGEAEIARRAAVEADLSRYLPAEVAKAIAAGTQRLELGGERRRVTILFADVVGFTPFAESASPERVVAFLNELFTVLTEVVFRHGGTVDKFVGDCVMAIFNAPMTVQDHEAKALAAAEDMHRFVEANAGTWKKKYDLDVKLGIGVAGGEALVGNLGSETRMEYTAIGDGVNVAARLEALAQPGQTLVTADIATLAGDGFTFHPLGEHPLRGKKQPVPIVELVT